MPRTLEQVDLALTKLESEVGRLRMTVVEQGGKIRALETRLAAAPGVPESLSALVELLRPLAAHAVNILKVQSGALGVRE